MAAVSIPEAQADEALMRRLVAWREADAFAELARRHAGLVFGTCLRVTGDRHDAEALAQECFIRLATRASAVRSSVAGWLHATAPGLSLNAVRARGRRRFHDSTAARSPSDAPDAAALIRPIEPILDESVAGPRRDNPAADADAGGHAARGVASRGRLRGPPVAHRRVRLRDVPR